MLILNSFLCGLTVQKNARCHYTGRHLPQHLAKSFHQGVIVLRHHSAESHIPGVQEREGGAVADHQSFFDAVFKQHLCINTVFLDAHQHKIPLGLIEFHMLPPGQKLENPLPLGVDELFRFLDILLVLEHDLSGDFCQAVDGPWVFAHIDFRGQAGISGDGIA